MPQSKPIIGLTGQIGAGKTLAASILRDLGCAVIDADALTGEVLAQAETIEFVRRHFGPRCIHDDGTVDRAALADIVFSDTKQKERLEQHIHPKIDRQRAALTTKYQADPTVKAIVIEAPLLLEKGLQRYCDQVILIHADLAIRHARVRDARCWTLVELARREKFFWPFYLKRSIADHIIYNNSTADMCRRQVEVAFSRIISSATCQPA